MGRPRQCACGCGPPDCNQCNPSKTADPSLPRDAVVTLPGNFSHGLPAEHQCTTPSRTYIPACTSGSRLFECPDWSNVEWYQYCGCGEPYATGEYLQVFRSMPFGRVGATHTVRRSVLSGSKCVWGLADVKYADTICNKSWLGYTDFPHTTSVGGHASIPSMKVYNAIRSDDMDTQAVAYPGLNVTEWGYYKDTVLGQYWIRRNDGSFPISPAEVRYGYYARNMSSFSTLQNRGGYWECGISITWARSHAYYGTYLRGRDAGRQTGINCYDGGHTFDKHGCTEHWVEWGNCAPHGLLTSPGLQAGQGVHQKGCVVATEQGYKYLPTTPASCPPGSMLVYQLPSAATKNAIYNPIGLTLVYRSDIPVNCTDHLFNSTGTNTTIPFTITTPSYLTDAYVSTFGLVFPSTLTAKFTRLP